MVEYTIGQTIFKAENVNHYFGTKTVLRDLSFEIKNIQRTGVKQGQIIALLGPSGIGKTQLFKILTGLSKPLEGKVSIGTELKEIEVGDVGIIAQDYPLFFNHTVYTNLALAIKQSNDSTNITDRIIEALTRFNMQDKLYSYPAELSGGQRQRIAILQQILCGHKFLLMDEPFSGLDIVMKDEVKQIIQEISLMDEENTIIIISHNIAEAVDVADEIWIMGYDKDCNGNNIDGARIQHSFDLKESGLAWTESNQNHLNLVQKIENVFRNL